MHVDLKCKYKKRRVTFTYLLRKTKEMIDLDRKLKKQISKANDNESSGVKCVGLSLMYNYIISN